jgi:hypothetical protein
LASIRFTRAEKGTQYFTPKEIKEAAKKRAQDISRKLRRVVVLAEGGSADLGDHCLAMWGEDTRESLAEQRQVTSGRLIFAYRIGRAIRAALKRHYTEHGVDMVEGSIGPLLRSAIESMEPTARTEENVRRLVNAGREAYGLQIIFKSWCLPGTLSPRSNLARRPTDDEDGKSSTNFKRSELELYTCFPRNQKGGVHFRL